MCELLHFVVICARPIPFKYFEGLPWPGIGISYRSVTNPVGVGEVYEGDGAAGDGGQELCGAWVQADVELLERVTGL